MENVFYVYQVGQKFVKYNQLKATLTTLEKCSWWTTIADCKTWERAVKFKYPTAKIKKAYLKVE